MSAAVWPSILNIDPTVVRLGWAVVSLFVPVGVVAYIVAALVMPVKNELM